MRQRRDSCFIFFAAAATAVLFFAGTILLPAFAEQNSESQDPPTLILGTVASDPGTTATIPLYYKPSPGHPVREVHLEVELVSNSVKFDKAQKGAAAESQDFDLAVEAKEMPPDDKNIQRTRLSINISLTGSDTGKSLPEGLWTFLDFRVPPEAKAFAISLNPIAISAQDAAHKPVKMVAEAGKIIVSVPDAPMAGCFFFTH